MTKDAYWFPHDANATNDPRMIKLRRLHGYEGIGVFWHIIERLRESDGYIMEIESIDDIVFAGQFDPGFIDSFFEIGLLCRDETYFWSESLCERMKKWDETSRKRSAAGKKGGRPRGKPGKSRAKAGPKPGESKNTKNNKDTKKKQTKNKSEILKEEFDRFYAVYPKQEGEIGALKAYKQAKKNGLPPIDELLAIVEDQKRWKWVNTEPQYIKNPKTWLQEGCWSDRQVELPQKPKDDEPLYKEEFR
jgi:hypothetical protein